MDLSRASTLPTRIFKRASVGLAKFAWVPPGGRHRRPCAGDVVPWRWTAWATRCRLHGLAFQIEQSRLSQASSHRDSTDDWSLMAWARLTWCCRGGIPTPVQHLSCTQSDRLTAVVVEPVAAQHPHGRPGQGESSRDRHRTWTARSTVSCPTSRSGHLSTAGPSLCNEWHVMTHAYDTQSSIRSSQRCAASPHCGGVVRAVAGRNAACAGSFEPP